VKIDEPGLYPFVSHSFASVDLGQVGLLKVGHVTGTMSHSRADDDSTNDQNSRSERRESVR
jgi:hypothetical protein